MLYIDFDKTKACRVSLYVVWTVCGVYFMFDSTISFDLIDRSHIGRDCHFFSGVRIVNGKKFKFKSGWFILLSSLGKIVFNTIWIYRRVSHVVCKHLNNFKTFSLLCRIEYITNNGQGRKKIGLGVKIDKRRRHCTNKSRGRFTCCNIPRNFPGFCDDRELSEAFGSMGVEYFNNSVVTPFGVQRTCCIGWN